MVSIIYNCDNLLDENAEEEIKKLYKWLINQKVDVKFLIFFRVNFYHATYLRLTFITKLEKD